jgi:protein-S-isoprenylcysteine O-methyltransferase Ste14
MKKEFFVSLVVLSSITHIIRLAYEILKHRKIIKAGKTSFVIVFINMILLWVSWVLLCRYDLFKVNLPEIVRYSGLILCVIGLIAFLTGLFTIKTLESYEGELITTGIYAILRHPMYFGFILWLIGFPIFFAGYFSMIMAILFIANVLFWRYLEEKELEKRFPNYSEYKKSTIF